MKIRLFIVDDQILFVDMLSGIITHRAADIEIVGTANSGEEALREIPKVQPDLVLLDVVMPDISGIEVLEQLKLDNPNLLIIMLTTFQDIEKTRKAMSCGAAGFLLKNTSVDNLIDKIIMISRGDIIISSQLGPRLFGLGNDEKREEIEPVKKKDTLDDIQRELLSNREQEIYRLLMEGYSNSEIANKLFIARQTVKNHIYSIYTKTGHHNRVQIISRDRNRPKR